MPRPKKQAAPQPTAIVASAARVMAGRRKNMPKGGAVAWQTEAWEMLDTVGELDFYREWMSNALSQCSLRVVEDTVDTEGNPVTLEATDPVVLDAMSALFGGEAGQSEMLAAMGGHLAVPGETWLCGLLTPPETADGPDMWRVLSSDEVSEVGTSWQIERGDGEPEKYGRDEVYMTRIWQPHPRRWVHANSSVRSALPILRELVALSKRQAAIIDSRLAGAGILCVPTEITFATPATNDGEAEEDEQQDPFMATLIEAMTTALDDQGDASAVVPIVVKAPAEHLDKIKHLTFASPLDDKAIEQRQELVGRLANSLNVPAEVLTGMADVNHWTGWLLDENAIKMHVEPVLTVIAHGLTTRYLWPVLQGEGNERMDPTLRRFRIEGETSNLRQRPNRSAEATGAHAGLVITNAAYAREVGFDKEDLLDPDSDEFKVRMLMQVAKGVTTADLTAAALEALGVAITPKPSEVEPTSPPVSSVPTPATPPAAPALVEQGAPEQPTAPPAVAAAGQAQAAALLAVSESIVLRAVERGWNKAGRRGKVRGPVSQDLLSTALDDAWGHVPRSAALCGVDEDRLLDALDTYARVLLASGEEHQPTVLMRLLAERVLDDPAAGLHPSVLTAAGRRPEQPINLTVQVSPPESHVNVTIPEGLVAAAAAPATPVHVDVHVPEQPTPEVTVNVEPTPVTVTNQVEAPAVTVENRVDPTPVTVEAHVDAPDVNVTVEPAPVNVKVEQPKPRTIRRKVIRDADGNITGTEEREA